MRMKAWSPLEVKKIVLTIVIYVLECLLSVTLLPFTIWKWLSERRHLLIILRATFEVALELSMWIILAGVSLLVAVAFTLDEVYRGKTELKSQREYLHTGPTSDNTDDDTVSRNPSFTPIAKKRKIVRSS
ncbi:PREDICTED: uncharacterized protein LOC106742089 [Dinoponera quadriceps]|uniref:Uncharacterized protein LOC106742089 n=1 Tax=Dinoponera quadriceps TaxID=609295 RepID=A0A6P3WWE1_DINQU|nr:PREDICTED: uncharacterized protein LOC106742089 [Dinoponera quadriceps]